MTGSSRGGRALTELHPPKRNRYYYGKLLDVLHLTMEQQYGAGADAQMNRLNFGPGVVCGLIVTPIEKGELRGLRVGAGLALDGWGRRIVVPDDMDILPLDVTDDCGVPLRPAPSELPKELVVSVCYRECEKDFAPALVVDPVCDGRERCEAGTWLESYTINIREGSQPDVVPADLDDALDELRAGRLQEALCALASEACADVPSDPCVPLANVRVRDDGKLAVDSCLPRPIVPTNRLLFELLGCLAKRIEELA